MNNYILPTYNRIKLKFIHGKGSWLYTKYDKYLDFNLSSQEGGGMWC